MKNLAQTLSWLSALTTQPSVEPWRDKEQMVHAQTIYDAAYEAGLTTAQVYWVAIYKAKTEFLQGLGIQISMSRKGTPGITRPASRLVVYQDPEI